MELLPGLDLRQLVQGWGAMPADRAANVLVQVCGSLQEAHEAGLVHRDIKAANVVLTRRGGRADVAKVLDFGLVHAAGEASDAELVGVVGTPAYLSPEAFEAPETVDARTDLYALGVMGFFLLAGRLPFEGETVMALCHQHLFEEPPPLPGSVPPVLGELILRCLAKDPADRPASAAEIARALEPIALSWTADRADAWWSDVPPPATGVPFDDGETLEVAPPAA